MGRRWIACLAAIAAFAATPGVTVHDLIARVRSAIEAKQSDNDLAKALHKLKLSESLDERVVEELQSEGAGPKAVAELELLRDSSELLPAPNEPLPFQSPAPPEDAEQRLLTREVRGIALNYNRSLPNFIAIESVHRYSTERGGWRLKDFLTIKLSFFEQREKYNVLTYNGRLTMVPYEHIGGAISQGEFGSLLAEVFEPRSAAELVWDHWTNLRSRPAHVYRFQVLPKNSRYTLRVGNITGEESVIAGQHGFVYVDRDTHQIVRILAITDGIPERFPVRNSSTLLDYGFVDIGGHSYLVPLRAEIRMVTSAFQTRNEVEFQSYRKFGAEASISFDGATEDKPVKH